MLWRLLDYVLSTYICDFHFTSKKYDYYEYIFMWELGLSKQLPLSCVGLNSVMFAKLFYIVALAAPAADAL